MSEPFETHDEEGTKRGRKDRPGTIDYSSQKPWWLVVLIVVSLLVFGVYIRNTNAPGGEQQESFWSFFRNKGAVETDSLGTMQDTLATTAITIPEMATTDETSGGSTDGWETPSLVEPGTKPVEPAFQTEAPGSATEVEATPLPDASGSSASEVSYRIVAGEFTTKKEADKRMQEIRQGNYPAQVIEPADPSGKFRVIAGEFKNLRTAETKAEALAFILEIKTRVEKKVE